MQTRRKSLSLAELGITVPKRSRVQNPSPPSTIVEGEEPPVKKTKRSHGTESPPPGLMSPPRTTTIRIKEEKPKQAVELSPPPSPVAEGRNKVDVEGINDGIVIGTIQQLERTGNRPHLVKELAAVLATSLHSVEKYGQPTQHDLTPTNCIQRSANPSALISSRLTAYLNRSWPAISPCPIAKDLSPIHPRRLYFFLTTMPRQPIPETVEAPPKARRIISPSLSSASAADEEDERYNRSRQALSPSPEVDLSSPDLDEESAHAPPTPGAPFSGRNSVTRERSASATMPQNRRGGSPQLEREEHDFKATANALFEQAQQQRRNSQDVNMELADAVAGAEQEITVTMSIEESEESAALKNSEVAAALFGQADHLKPLQQHIEFSSPVIEPQNALRIDTGVSHRIKEEAVDHMTLEPGDDTSKDVGMLSDWDPLQSPENIELGDLDEWF